MQTELNQKNEPLLWSCEEFADVLGVSKRTIRRMDQIGKLPRRIVVGRLVRWRVDEIRSWIDAGCPHRDEWEAVRKNGRDFD